MHSGALLEEALWFAVAQALPLALAAGGAALVVGVLAYRIGLVDPTVVLVARAAAVLGMLATGGAAMLADTSAWTDALWSQIGAIGRGAP